ncbi:MAG: energy transducer TonB, partial [Thiohalophilus sp.]
TGEPEPVTSQPLFEAEYLNNRPPDYPRASLRRGEEGNVELRVRVGADGNPQAVELASSSGSTRLDRAALQAVKRWRFEPARRGGSAVAAWVVVPITFKLES